MRRNIVFLALILFQTYLIFSIEIKKVEKIILRQKNNDLIAIPFSFFVTEKDYIYVLDKKLANIQIFDKNGKRVKVFGRKGAGPNEFLNPIACSNYKNLIMIYDFKRSAIFFYKTDKYHNFIFVKKNRFSGLSMDFKFLNENLLLVAGMDFDVANVKTKKSYNLYTHNIKEQKNNYLLSSAECFGVDDQDEAGEVFVKKIVYFATNGYSDYTKKYFYFTHSVNLRLVRMDRVTGKTIVFGEKTSNYVQPEVTVELKKAVKKRKQYLSNEIEKKMSIVKKIICFGKRTIGVIYTKYNEKTDTQDLVVQVYDDNGTFLKEMVLMKTKTEFITGILMYYRKIDNILYVLETVSIGDSDMGFEIHKFKVIE